MYIAKSVAFVPYIIRRTSDVRFVSQNFYVSCPNRYEISQIKPSCMLTREAAYYTCQRTYATLLLEHIVQFDTLINAHNQRDRPSPNLLLCRN